MEHREESAEKRAIHECMKRLGKRYQRTHLDMIETVRPQLREWFEARMDYLQDEYRKAADGNDDH